MIDLTRDLPFKIQNLEQTQSMSPSPIVEDFLVGIFDDEYGQGMASRQQDRVLAE